MIELDKTKSKTEHARYEHDVKSIRASSKLFFGMLLGKI
jgi:hypothetical protein